MGERLVRLAEICEAQVSEPPHYFHRHQCSRKAREIVNGKSLCTQHAQIELRRSSRGYGVRT